MYNYTSPFTPQTSLSTIFLPRTVTIFPISALACAKSASSKHLRTPDSAPNANFPARPKSGRILFTEMAKVNYRKISLEYAQRPLEPVALQIFRKRTARRSLPIRSTRGQMDPVVVQPAKIAEAPGVTVRLYWRDESGRPHKKTLPWKNSRPATERGLREWIEEYFERLRDGYRPAGFEQPPVPHCVRLNRNGSLIAEIFTRSMAESLVTALRTLDPGSVPEVVPVPPQEAKPNREHQGLESETITAPGDTGRRSPVDRVEL